MMERETHYRKQNSAFGEGHSTLSLLRKLVIVNKNVKNIAFGEQLVHEVKL